MAASLLALAVALLVSAGFGGVDRGAAAPLDTEGGEVRVPDLKICRRGWAFFSCKGLGAIVIWICVGVSQVTYGSVIKLMHEKTKHRLHSHDVPYGSGSGQQSVTGFPEGDDSNSYWVRLPLSDQHIKWACLFTLNGNIYMKKKINDSKGLELT